MSTKHPGSGSTLMQILALPRAPPYRDLSRAKDSVELRHATFRAARSRSSSRDQRQIPCHILRVAAERLLQTAFVANFSRLPVDNLVIASRMALY